MTKLKDLPIYFIRHNWKKEVREEWNQILLDKKKIAIHFNNEEEVEFENFSKKERIKRKFKKAWKCLEDIRKKGAIVVAQYDNNYCLIGKIHRGTEIKYLKELPGVKTLQLRDVEKIKLSEFPLLVSIKPRQQTISRMKQCRNFILYVWGKEKLKFNVSNMHPKMQEQMCVEWLRIQQDENLKLKYQIRSAGGTFEAVDIIGQSQGDKLILAQVTWKNPKKAKTKIESLKSARLSKDDILIFFSNGKHDDNDLMKFVHLQSVWDDLRKIGFKKMLRQMIGEDLK